MIALDANLLIYARRSEAAEHAAALAVLTGLSEGDRPWAIPWLCALQYLRVVTHGRIYSPPTPLDDAVEDLERLIACPTLSMLGPGPAHLSHLRRLVLEGRASGSRVYDAEVAALCIEHGAELLTHDRGFRSFPGLRWRDPIR